MESSKKDLYATGDTDSVDSIPFQLLMIQYPYHVTSLKTLHLFHEKEKNIYT